MKKNEKKQDAAEEFLEIYNELDAYLRKKVGCDETVSHMFVVDRLAESNKIIRNHKEDLKLYARLRNAIIHNPFSAKIETIAEPHAEIVKKYKLLRDELMNPPTALSVAIKADRIYSVSMESNARETMQVMVKRLFSYVPVIDTENRMAGVFSENAVFMYLVRNEICSIDAKTKISEFAEFIPVNQHVNEYFDFVSRNTTLAHIKDLFERGLVERKRLGAVYITENGKQDESLLGMVTAWDIAGNNKNI